MKITNLGAILEGKAVILDTCTAIRNYGLKSEMRILLSKVIRLEIMELNGAEVCCGFGGTFSVKFDEVASSLAASKLEQVQKSGAQYIISSDYSCLMHLKGYASKNNIDIKMLHIADVLAEGWD